MGTAVLVNATTAIFRDTCNSPVAKQSRPRRVTPQMQLAVHKVDAIHR